MDLINYKLPERRLELENVGDYSSMVKITSKTRSESADFFSLLQTLDTEHLNVPPASCILKVSEKWTGSCMEATQENDNEGDVCKEFFKKASHEVNEKMRILLPSQH